MQYTTANRARSTTMQLTGATPITWSADYSVQHVGWQICYSVDSITSRTPTRSPTRVPTTRSPTTVPTQSTRQPTHWNQWPTSQPDTRAPTQLPTSPATQMATSLAPSDSTVAAEHKLDGLTSFPPSMQALFIQTWKSLLGVDRVEIISYSITTERRAPTVSVNFQPQAADASSVADMSSTMSSAVGSGSGSPSFSSHFNTLLAESGDPEIASQVVTGVVQTVAPAIVTGPSMAPESDEGGAGSSMVLIFVAAGAGLLVAVGGWIIWRWCCNKPPASQAVTVVQNVGPRPNYNPGAPAPPSYSRANSVGQYHGAAPPVYQEPVALNPAVFDLTGNGIQVEFDYDHVQQNGRDEQSASAPSAYNPQSQLQPGNQPLPIYIMVLG